MAEFSVEHKTSVKTQLSAVLRALRKDHGNGPKLGGFVPGVCKDTRRNQRLSESTIHTEKQFNDFLCFKPVRALTPWIAMIRSGMRDDHRLVMTHGDLHPRNIMVEWEQGEEEGANRNGGERRKGQVTAVTDWEKSGWYPGYWEFVKALNTIPARGKMSDWFDYLPTDAVGTWPVELGLDRLLDRWLG